MAFTCRQIHNPRQVIIVALLTSIFWFVLNTVILISYQGNIALYDVKAARKIREETKNYDDEFERQLGNANNGPKLMPRGISEVEAGEDVIEQLDTIDKGEILQDNDKRKLDTQLMKNGLINEIEDNSVKKQQFINKPGLENIKKKPRIIKKKQISPVRTIPSEDPRKHAEDTKHFEDIPNLPDFNARDPNGPGEDGKAVVIAAGEKKNEKEGYNKYAFNEYASQKISFVRSVPDTRSVG